MTLAWRYLSVNHRRQSLRANSQSSGMEIGVLGAEPSSTLSLNPLRAEGGWCRGYHISCDAGSDAGVVVAEKNMAYYGRFIVTLN